MKQSDHAIWPRIMMAVASQCCYRASDLLDCGKARSRAIDSAGLFLVRAQAS